MEGNEAPEKIYVVIDPVWGSMRVNYDRNDVNNIEYTRTDAFIEKACEWINIHDSYSTPTNVLVEDFRKAMKGE